MAGAVAVGNVERWTGVYDEAGSEPESLGHALWTLLVRMHDRGEGLEELAYRMERWGRWEAIARAEGLPVAPNADRSPLRVTSSVVDPRFVVWVYLVDPVARRLILLATEVVVDPATGEERARYREVAVLPLPPAPEPSWRDLARQ